MRHSPAEHEDAGEGYFASISDLMVGILFVFLLMLTAFAINYADEDKDEIIRKLQEQAAAQEKRIADLEGQAIAKDKRIANLKGEVIAKDRKIADLEKQVTALRLELAVVRGEMAELLAEQLRLSDGLANLVAQLEGLSIDLKNDQRRSENVRRDLLIDIQRKLEERKVEVDVDTEQGILRLRGERMFNSNEASFTTDGGIRAQALIEVMAPLLPCFSTEEISTPQCTRLPIFETVLIEGHTDAQRRQMEGGNWKLSTDRALAFLDLLTTVAPNLATLKNGRGQLLLGLAGYGETRPFSQIDERNRRIEIRFLLATDHVVLGERVGRLEALLLALRNLAASRR